MKYYNPTTEQITATPHITNVLNATHYTILANGWKEFIDNEPIYNAATHYITRYNVIIEGDTATQLYIIHENPIIIPDEISAAQGLAYLIQLEIYDEVLETINTLNDAVISTFWERSATWHRNSTIINNLAIMFGIDLDNFFVEANKINI